VEPERMNGPFPWRREWGQVRPSRCFQQMLPVLAFENENLIILFIIFKPVRVSAWFS
jgi:hypothetical protein